MDLTRASSSQAANVTGASLNNAAETPGPRQRNNIPARTASSSQSTISKGIRFAGSLFKARPGDASSVPRSAQASSSTSATAALPAQAPTPPVASTSARRPVEARAPAVASTSANGPLEEQEPAPPAAPAAPGRAAPPARENLELTPRLTMALENQHLVLGQYGRPNRTERLLDGVLNKPGQQYQQLHRQRPGDTNKIEYLLTDMQDRLVHAQASKLAVSVFKSSEVGTASMPALPGDAHRAQITGVHSNAQGDAFRVHEKKLYQLDNEGRWQLRPDAADLKSLHSIDDGQVYALTSEGKVHSLADLTTPLNFTHKVSSLGRGSDGQLLALSEDSQKNLLLERLNTFGNGQNDMHVLLPPTGTANDEAMKPQSVTMSGDTLYATTASGKLLQADMPSVDERRETLFVVGEQSLREAAPSPALAAAFGHHTFSDLFHDENGLMHAKVKDSKGAEHSASWDNHRADFKPGWNMAPLIMDRQLGLPQLAPRPSQHIQLPRGRIAQHDGNLIAQDPRTGEWKKTSEKEIKALQAGQDGFAYLIDKDGKLKQLKVVPQAAAHEMGKGVDLALPGRGTEAKGSVMRGAEHLVADKLAVQNDQKYMTLSGGDLRLHDQNGERALLPQPPGTGDIQAISTGGKHWFVLRDNTIHQLSAEGDDPKKVQSARAWQPTEHAGIPPNAVIEDLRPGHDGRLLAQTNQGEFVKADDNTWAPVAAEPAPRANTHEHFNQLADREPDIMRRGAFKTTVNVMGRNVEGMKREQFAPNSIFQNYLTSHFSPTGAVKVPGDSIQHAWKGRVGLKPIYNEETQVLKDLQALGAKARASTMPPSQPMAARIEELAPHLMSPESSELSELLGWFQDTVKNNLQQTLRELAEDQGALLKNGERDPTYRRRARNNDMFADVVSTLRHNGIARDDGLADMLTTLEGSGFTLESRRTQSLLGGSRKRGDEQALLRARLALDVKVLDQISSAVDIFSKEVKRSGNPDFSGMARDLALLHNDAYEGSDIKRYTDAGFRNYAALETSYDATKNLLKHLRKENHPLKRNLLQGIESRPGENNADITRNLTNALRDLEPRESLKLNRNYGGGVNGGASGPAGAAFLGARGSIDPERTYGMTFTRFDRGLKVVLNREGAVSSTLGFGFGGGKTSPGTTPGDSHENLQTNGFWAAGGLDGKYKYADNTALSFFIRDDELDAFMADLMQTPLHSSKQDATAGLKPMDLLNRGVESEVRTTQKHTFDLDLSANVEGRFNKGQTDAEPVAGFMRFGVGLLASMSLMNGEKERTQGRGSDGLHTDIYSSNRARFLEKGSVTGYARMFSSVFSARPNQSFISGGAPMGISATLAVDNKTGKTYDVRFKDALPVQTADVKSLSESLEKAYPDLSKNPSPSAKTPDLVLQDLKAKYINDQPAENDAQHAALISLKQLDRQNTAASQGSSLMTTMDMVVKHNNVNRVDQAALLKRGIDPIKHLLGLDCNPGNAGHIHDIMSGDPQLNSLLQAMKTSNGTTRAEIKLEVNDDIKQRIEDGALSGRLSDKMLKEMLGNKENLRIKSISVFRAAAKDDSLGIALPFVSYKSGSNLTVERLLGEVTFDYGADQLNPKKVTADGEIADRANPEPALAMAQENAGVFRPA